MKYKIGIDGGGTKTEGVLVDEEGNVAAVHVGAGCNPSLVGLETAKSIVTATLDSLRAQAGGLAAGGEKPECVATLLCMAGSASVWGEFAESLTGYGKVVASDDSLPVLELATNGRPGLVLHSGTGSFVAARAPDNSIHYAGGVGWRFGDPGSGHDIGRRAIGHALLDLQGLAPESPLALELLKYTGLKDAAAITRYFHHESEAPERIAPFATNVIQLAEQGDKASLQVIAKSAGELLDLAIRVGTRHFSASVLDSLTVGLSGAILTNQLVQDALASRAPFHLVPVVSKPIEGVRRMLAAIE